VQDGHALRFAVALDHPTRKRAHSPSNVVHDSFPDGLPAKRPDIEDSFKIGPRTAGAFCSSFETPVHS
jgi:hypothetical protein